MNTQPLPDGDWDCGDDGKPNRALGHSVTPPMIVPLSMIRPPGFTPDDTMKVLAEVLADMARIIADLNPGLNLTRSPALLRQCDRLGWMPDGTPVVKI